jgi:acetylornithine deacetylase/succinyl-diaminopimelate desuccinylase-like protein
MQQDTRAEFEAKLKEWVEIPTISAEPEHRGDIRELANRAVAYLRASGGEAELCETPGNPVVLGRFRINDAWPTVTIYNHLDVQPANEPQWKHQPFVFRNEDGRYFGRGATDDKGPALTALFGARQAMAAGVPVNIKVIWELEEEIGSPNFERFVVANRPKLDTDSVVVSDTIWISRGRPAVAYGLRGLAPMRIFVETGGKDIHSGLTGGAARNPIGEIAQILSEIHDARTGRVKVPGFYDDVVGPTQRELAGFLASGFDVSRFKRAHELKSLRVTDRKDIVRRIWASPTFEVHGVVGGYTGPGVKTAIAPAAEAKVSMRLVPRQSPKRIFNLVRRFIKERHPDARVVAEPFLEPFIGPSVGPYADAARGAMRSAFGKDPAFVREGGSIGAVVTLQKYLKVPIVFLGLSLPEHGYHAPNENYDWEQASGGMRMFADYFQRISQL